MQEKKTPQNPQKKPVGDVHPPETGTHGGQTDIGKDIGKKGGELGQPSRTGVGEDLGKQRHGVPTERRPE